MAQARAKLSTGILQLHKTPSLPARGTELKSKLLKPPKTSLFHSSDFHLKQKSHGLGSINIPYISGYFKVCKEDKLADPQMYLNEPVLNMTASLVLHLTCLFQGSCFYLQANFISGRLYLNFCLTTQEATGRQLHVFNHIGS